jgi:microcystin-dependent protein
MSKLDKSTKKCGGGYKIAFFLAFVNFFNYSMPASALSPLTTELWVRGGLATKASIEQGAKADAALPATGGTMTGSIAMGGGKITGMAAPTDSGDAATKAYVDSGLAAKINVASNEGSDGQILMTNEDGSTKWVSGASPEILKAIYPVGAIYISTNSANPETLFGFGTWERFGNGRVLVGVNESDSSFDSVQKTGGAKTHTLAATEMPSHNHSGTALSAGAHQHSFIGADWDTKLGQSAVSGQLQWKADASQKGYAWPVTYEGEHAHTLSIGNTGGGGAHNNLQPYITVYIWRRSA